MKKTTITATVVMMLLSFSTFIWGQNISISVHSGIAQPTDSEQDVTAVGFNVGVKGFYHLNDHLWAGARLALNRWTPNLPGRDVKWLECKGSTMIIEVVPSVRYVVEIPETKDHLFTQAGVGFFMRKDQLELTGIRGEITKTSESKSGLGVNFGLGFDFKFTDKMKVEVFPLYELIFDNIGKGTFTTRFYSLNLGVLF